jgi:SAM-dependent methyltransferase
MKLLLYGCGSRGKYLLDSFRKINKVEIIGITDKNTDSKFSLEEENRSLFWSVNEILELDFDYVLITTDKYFEDVFKELTAIGLAEKKIISLKIFNDLFIKKSNDQIKGLPKCVLCTNHVFGWLLTGERNTLFEQKSVVGAGLRSGICPICGSTDRLRYVHYILNKYTTIFDDTSNILHFAPESKLIEEFRKRGENYITADLMKGRADVVADITNLQFKDNQFDWIICNHVMEHIENEGRALLEIKRCLKPGGSLIITVPICWEADTYENKDIITKNEKTLYYGQSDHERLYGRDIEARFEKYGFDVKGYKNTDILNEKEIEENGFIVGDSVFICAKV